MDEYRTFDIEVGQEEIQDKIPNHYLKIEKQEEENYWQMVRNYLEQAVPSMLAIILWRMQETIVLVYIVKCSENADDLIAGFGIAMMISNVCFNSMVIGLNGALETLVSQAYGAKDFKMCGVLLHRSRIAIILSCLPSMAILLNIAQPLKALGQPEGATDIAQTYLTVYLPGLFIFALNDGLRRFFNSMGQSSIPFIMQAVGNFCQVGLCQLLVKEWQMGVTGIGIAITIANGIIFIGLSIAQYMIEETYAASHWPTLQALQDMSQYVKLGLPISLMMCFEWSVFQVMLLLCGILGVTVQAAQILLGNCYVYFFVLSLGMQSAACSFIGQEIGRADVKKAKQYYQVSKHVTLTIAFLSSLTFALSLPSVLRFFFSPSINVANACLAAMPAACLTIVFDQMQAYQQGVIKALGVQASAVKITLVAYCPLYGPVAYLLAIYMCLELKGLWMALLLTMAVISISLDQVIEQTNWQKAVDDSTNRLNEKEK